MSKKLIYFTAVIALCIGFASCIRVMSSFSSITAARGNSVITTVEKTTPAFQRINIRSGATVRFHQSDEFRVIVTTDEDLHEYVEIETRGHTLFIGTRGDFTSVLFSHLSTMNNGSVAIRGDNVIINGQSVSITTSRPFTQFIVDVYAPTLRGVSVSSGSFENFET